MARKLGSTGVFRNNRMAFEAVARGLVRTAIIEQYAPISGPFENGTIKDNPVQKWTGLPIYVVHDHGQCQFGVAYTVESSLNEMSYRDREHFSDEEANQYERRLSASNESLRDEMKQYSEYKENAHPEHVGHWEREIAKIRIILRARDHNCRSAYLERACA